MSLLDGPDVGELAPYRAIGAHAERELELAGRGEVDELVALGSRWEQLIADLPPRPPLEARGLLERAVLMHERTRIELIRLREAVLMEQATAANSKRAADGYAGERVRQPRLDRSA